MGEYERMKERQENIRKASEQILNIAVELNLTFEEFEKTIWRVKSIAKMRK